MAVRALWCPHVDIPPSIRALSVVKRLRGGCQPFLVKCSDGLYYVTKANLNPAGPHVLANEFIATNLMLAAGLPVPASRVIHVSKSFIQENPDLRLETQSGSRPINEGLHFGSRFLLQPEGAVRGYLANGYDSLLFNREDSLGSHIFDVWAEQRDSREFLFVRPDCNSKFRLFLIDNSHLFSGPCRRLKYRPGESMALDRRVYIASPDTRAIDAWCLRFQQLLSIALDHCTDAMPDEWRSEGHADLLHRLRWRLDNIRALFDIELTRTQLTMRAQRDRITTPTSPTRLRLGPFRE